MIAIGGAIGTGLFLGSGLQSAPRAERSCQLPDQRISSLLLMGALAEMAVAQPAAGSFSVFADRYLGPLGGHVIRWAYVTGIALAVDHLAGVRRLRGPWLTDKLR